MPQQINEPPKLLAYHVKSSINDFELRAAQHKGELLGEIFKKSIHSMSYAFTRAYFSGELKKNVPYLWKGRIRCISPDPNIFRGHNKEVDLAVIAEPANSDVAGDFEEYTEQIKLLHPDELFRKEYDQFSVPRMTAQSDLYLSSN